jgi:hypothetical protein
LGQQPTNVIALSFPLSSKLYAAALLKCKEINQELNLDPLGEKQRHHRRFNSSWARSSKPRVANTNAEQQQKPYDASRIKELVEQETQRIQTAQDASSGDLEWTAKVKDVAYGVIKLAEVLKPVIDVFVPQSPEYRVPYACVWIVFKVRREGQVCLKATSPVPRLLSDRRYLPTLPRGF